MTKNELSGFILIHKPIGISSNEALNIIKRKLGVKKMGHGGTLDPFASGLLFVVIGDATKYLPYIHLEPKGYEAVLKLGIETDTLDSDGQLINKKNVPHFSNEILKQHCQLLSGPRNQLAPIYSAKKIDGQRSYDLARRGEAVERKNCPIEIFELSALKSDDSTIQFSALCSSGTYVRVIGEEMAHLLGTVGHLTHLNRNQLGAFVSQSAVALESVTREFVQTIEFALPYPRIELDEPQFKFMNVGRAVALTHQTPGRKTVFYEGKFIGLGEFDAGLLKPLRLTVQN